MKQNVEINIEVLVLDGFKTGDRYIIGNALEHELARLFIEQSIPGVLSESINAGRIDAGTFKTSTNSKAESIGIQTAKSVYKSLKP